MMLDRLMNEWPFPLGKSPFGISGLVYQSQKKAYAKSFGGHQEVLSIIRDKDPPLADFLDQAFLSTMKYDIFGLISAAEILSRAAGREHKDFLHEYARKQFEMDTGGFYRVILRLTSPHKIMEKLSSSDPYYFDFSPSTLVESGSKNVTYVKREFPWILRGWYDIVLESYGEVVMGRCGVKDFELNLRSELTGAKIDTVELCDYYIEVRWK